jgi:hypothetical protein
MRSLAACVRTHGVRLGAQLLACAVLPALRIQPSGVRAVLAAQKYVLTSLISAVVLA